MITISLARVKVYLKVEKVGKIADITRRMSRDINIKTINL
jgi:hypothetical protein